MRFSANLGFLWADLPLPDAIRAAARAGFDAVECHWPYDVPVGEIRAALRETGLPLLGLNTSRGTPDEFGLSALPGREADARAAIDEAIEWAGLLGARNVHVMAGLAEGAAAAASFAANLRHACDRAAPSGRTILIEPINQRDAPGYFLRTTAQAIDLIAAVARPNLRLLFDCYHVQITEGAVIRRVTEVLPWIGHIQFAAVPDRGEPDRGDLDYADVFAHLARLGYDAPLGAEYRPRNGTDAGLGWMERLRPAHR